MKYESFAPESKEELNEIFAGFTNWLRKVADDAEINTGQAEMAVYVNKWEQQMMRIAGRFVDADNKPINRTTLGKLPVRALYGFLSTQMKLPDAEIQRVLAAVNTMKVVALMKMSRAPALAAIKNQKSTIDQVWAKPIAAINPDDQPKTIEALVNIIVGTAALRKMELDTLSSQEQPADNKQDTTPLTPGNQPPGTPPSATPPTGTPPAGGLNTGWTNGDPIKLRDGTVVNPADAPYTALAAILTRAQQAELV